MTQNKVAVFKRIPPGDRWRQVNGSNTEFINDTIHESLTDALEACFQNTGQKQYYIDAGEGMVYIALEDIVVAVEEKKFSIYDE
jgi:hypothetical protein